MNKEPNLYKVYDGNKMQLFGWSRPVVVDLNGLRCNCNECDLLTTSEDANQLIVLNKCIVSVRDSGIYILTDREKAFGYSIGVEVEASELIQTGTRKVNGLEIEAPFYHVTSSVLKEVVEQPDDNRCQIHNVTPEEMRKRIDELEKMKNKNDVIQKELIDKIDKLTKEYDGYKREIFETMQANERLRNALKALVDAASPFCRQHQQFVTLHDCVNNAAELIDSNNPF